MKLFPLVYDFYKNYKQQITNVQNTVSTSMGRTICSEAGDHFQLQCAVGIVQPYQSQACCLDLIPNGIDLDDMNRYNERCNRLPSLKFNHYSN